MNAHSDEGLLSEDERGTDPVQRQLVAARRRQILDAATRVFAERGYPRATIRQVARSAGVAEGTIYNYFADKEDLLFGLLDRVNESDRRPEVFAELASTGNEAPAPAAVRAAFEALLRHRWQVAGDALPLWRALLPELLFNERLRRRWLLEVVAPATGLAEAALQRLMEAGALRPQRSDLLTRLVAGSVFGTLLLEMVGDPVLAEDRDAVPAALVSLLFDGLAPEDDAEDGGSGGGDTGETP
jgi:AcrR family transcriptional regulator